MAPAIRYDRLVYHGVEYGPLRVDPADVDVHLHPRRVADVSGHDGDRQENKMKKSIQLIKPQRPSPVYFQSSILPAIEETVLEINTRVKQREAARFRAIYFRTWHPCPYCGEEVKIQGRNMAAHKENHLAHRIVGDEQEWIEWMRRRSAAMNAHRASNAAKGRHRSLAARVITPQQKDMRILKQWLARKWSGTQTKMKERTQWVAFQLFSPFIVVTKVLPFSQEKVLGSLPARPVKVFGEYVARITGHQTNTLLIARLLTKEQRAYLRDRYRVKEVIHKHVLYGPREPMIIHLYEPL